MIYKWIIVDNHSKNRQLLQINWNPVLFLANDKLRNQ